MKEIGFAIPVDEALEVASTMIERQRATRQELAMKVGFDPTVGVVIKSVEKDSVADKAGFKAGDKVVSIGGKEVTRRLDYELALYDVTPDTTLDISVQREGETINDLCLNVVALKKLPESESVMERAWQVLGIKATPVDQNEVSRVDSNYHGGMRVTSVRAGSPAAKAGIRNGDILVGILTYETTSPSDLAWILDSKDLRSNQGAKFYVVRDRETLFGSLRVASSPSRPVR